MAKPKATYISFGGGVRLVHESYMIQELKGCGLTKRSFRALCKAICCPLVYMSSNEAFVDPMTFQICMKAITRAGCPDFRFPKARMGKTEKTNNTRFPGRVRMSVPPEEIRENWRMLVGEILAARKLAHLVTPKSTQRALLDVSTRLAELAISALPDAIASEYSEAVTPAPLGMDINAGNQNDKLEADELPRDGEEVRDGKPD